MYINRSFAIYYDDQIHHWNIVALDSLPDRLVSDFNRAYAAKYQLDDETPGTRTLFECDTIRYTCTDFNVPIALYTALFADSVPQNEDLSDKYDEIKECLEAAARSKGNAVFSSADIQDADVNYVRQILELNVRLAEV